MIDSLSPDEIDALRYAKRNHGRIGRFDSPGADNAVVDRLTGLGLLCDGGPSSMGRWRNLTVRGAAVANGESAVAQSEESK